MRRGRAGALRVACRVLVELALVFILAMCLSLAVTPAPAGAIPATESIVCVSSDGLGRPSVGISWSRRPAISPDGRYVAFVSASDDLVPAAGGLSLDGALPGALRRPSVDPSGGLPPGPVSYHDVFVKDTLTGAIRCASTDSAGNPANGPSDYPDISADGRFVVFRSDASNLVPGDTNGDPDIFLKDLATGVTRRLSTNFSMMENYGGTAGNDERFAPVISDDGRYVAFDTQATLLPDDTNRADDIYLLDLAAGTTKRVSTDAEGREMSRGGWGAPSMSADARFVTFTSDYRDDVLIKDTATDEVRIVETRMSGAYRASISADGRYVVYEKDSCVWRKDMASGEVRRVAAGDGAYPAREPSISSDGRYVAFAFRTYTIESGTTEQLYVKDMVSGELRPVSTDAAGVAGNDSSYGPAVSSDGRYAFFTSSATNLVPHAPSIVNGVYRKAVDAAFTDFHHDPVPVVPANPETQKPVLIFVAGLDSDTGYHAIGDEPGSGAIRWYTTDPANRGTPWNYLASPEALKKLGAADALVMPTAKGATTWPQDKRECGWGYIIDSNGALAGNMTQLSSWLSSASVHQRIGEHPIIFVTHSYGGVITRSMLADDVLPEGALRKQIAGVIQFGSPNGGSQLADRENAEMFWAGPGKSPFTLDLAPGPMKKWNRLYSGPIEVPVDRFGGSYAPWSLPILGANAGLLPVYSQLMGGKDNDGMVPYGSLANGLDSLLDQQRDFGGGSCTSWNTLAHAGDMPGVRSKPYKYFPGGWVFQDPIEITFSPLVPRSSSDTLFYSLMNSILNMKTRYQRRGTSSSVAVKAAAEEAADESSHELPKQVAHVGADTTATIALPLDATATVIVSSASGTPTVSVRGAAGDGIPAPGGEAETGAGITAFARVVPSRPGTFFVDLRLPAGMSGDTTIGVVCSGGSALSLSTGDSAFAGTPATVTARFVTEAGSPIVGAVVAGTAQTGGTTIPLTFTDDGTGADSVAGDGSYAAGFVPSAAGRWLVRATARRDASSRVALLVLDVGQRLATVTGPLAVVTPAGPGATFASFGVGVPLTVSRTDTYTVSAHLSDAAGTQVGVLKAKGLVLAGAPQTLVASIGAGSLSRIAEGRLTVGTVTVSYEGDGIMLDAGSSAGITTPAGYSASDFYAFGVTVAGPAANPSPTGAVHFEGVALDTSAAVAAVEYSIDGSATWAPATPTDGAFDSTSEQYSIDLALPDGAYGLLVRETGSDGSTLPVEEWAGVRFTIDTVSPAAVTALAAVVTTDGGAPIARLSWLPSDPPSDTVAPVRYRVSADGSEIAQTYDQDLGVALASPGEHVFAVQPIDQAGNAGDSTSTTISDWAVWDHAAPVTSLGLFPASGSPSWSRSSVLVTLDAVDAAGGSGVGMTLYRVDARPSALYAGPFLVSGEGVHALEFASFDLAGNHEQTQTVAVGIDQTKPVTTSDAALAYTGSALIHLTGSDALSGVAATRYSLDGAAAVAGTSVSVTAPGPHTLAFHSTDVAGNVEDTKIASFTIAEASTPPTVTTPPSTIPTPPAGTFVAVQGANRIGTAIEAAKAAFTKADTVVIATAWNFPDALGGASLAGALDAPLLLTDKDALPSAVTDEIRRLGAKDAVILGGTPAVGAGVESRLASLLGGGSHVRRIGGADRYDTAALIGAETLKALDAKGRTYGGTVLVAVGTNFPDALAASPLAAAKGWPILLARTEALPEASAKALTTLAAKKAIMLGSDKAVGSAVEGALQAKLGGGNVSRLAGASRYLTAIEIAKYGAANGLGFSKLAIATGENYPDALSGGVMAGRFDSMMLLTPKTSLQPDVAKLISANKAGIEHVYYLGSTGAVSQSVRVAVSALLK